MRTSPLPPTAAAPRRARRRPLALALIALAPLVTTAAHAADPPKISTPQEARDQRDRIKREQADIAAKLVPLEATEDDLERALAIITSHVQAQQQRVSETTADADDAQRRADSLAVEVRSLEVGITDLERQVRERAIAAYVDPGGRNSPEELILKSGDLTQAERQRVLLDQVNGADADARDRLRAERLRLADIRVEAEAAAAEASQKQAEAQDELRVLATAHEQQRKVKAEIDARIADYRVHALELAKQDGELERIIHDLTYRAQVQANGPPRQGSLVGSADPNVIRPVGPGGLIWPIAGRLTQGFGGRGGHPGIDVAAPLNTPIYAARAGRVIFAGWNNGGYGNLVLIDHGDFVTAYAHQNYVVAAVGQEVTQGQLIGYEGTTGYSTGPHLHFEVRIGGGKANPLSYLP